MKLRLLLLLLAATPLLSKAQHHCDHLTPDTGIMGIYDFQFEYYSKVRTVLFEDLPDSPVIRFLRMPSFTPENVLDIQKNNKGGNHYLIYRVCENMVWENKNWKRIKVKEYRVEIDNKSVGLIQSLFLKAIMQTKYCEENMLGLDGVDYYFYAWDFGLKSGTIWSPSTPNMNKLIEIAERLTELAKSNRSVVRFDKELIEEIETLKRNLD